MTRGTERGEPETTAVEALYDAFAPSLYRYAWALLGDDPEQVAEAVHDGLVAGVALEARRADPADRGPWLYALVRSTCQRRGLAHVSPYTRLATVPDEEPVAHMFSRLPASHRELVELNLRHALPNSAVARVLGLDSQICGELSRSAIRRAAESLSEDTDTPDEPAWRTQVHRVSSALSLLRPPGPPPGLRDRIVLTCVDPDLAGVRERIAAGMHPLTVEGYPLHRARVPGEPEEVPEAVVPGPEPLPRALSGDRLTTRDHPVHEEAVTPLTGPDTVPGDGDAPQGRAARLRWPLPAVSGLATVIVAVSLWAWASAVGGPSTMVGTAPADSERSPQGSKTEVAATASDAKPDAGSTASPPATPPTGLDPEPEEQGEATGGNGSPLPGDSGAEQAPPGGEQEPSAEDGRSEDRSGGSGGSAGDDDAPGDQPEEGGSGDGGGDGLLSGLLGLFFGGG